MKLMKIVYQEAEWICDSYQHEPPFLFDSDELSLAPEDAVMMS